MATSFETEAELQKLYQDRVKLFEQMTQSSKSLLALHQQIAKIMGEVDPNTLSDGYENLDEKVKEVAESLSEAGDASEDTFSKLALGLGEAESMTTKLSKRMIEFSKNAMKVSVPIAAFNGFVKGLKLSYNAMGSLVNVTKNVAASVGHFALSVISFPFKMLQGLLSMAQQGGGDNGLRQELENIRKEFGDLRKNASAAIIDIARSMRGPLAETGLRARRIFGNLTEALQFFHKVATNLGPMFNLIRDQLTASADEAQRFGAYLKGLGIQDSPEAQKGLARLAITTGKSLTEIGREITTFAYGMGEAFGINGLEISRDVATMTHDFDNFGNLSIQTLTNVSIYARKLGVEVEKLKGSIAAFDDFEKAAEGAAQLSQAFGLNVDAFRLMQEQDPAARIEQLRKAFFQAGRSVENMTRQERALLAEQTGLDQETLSLVFSQRNASTSYADIQKQSEATKKKQLSQAEAMQKLSNSIERLVKSGQSLNGGFFKIFFDGFTRGIMMSRDFRGLMRDLRRDMRTVFQAGREVGRMFVTEFPGIQEMIQGLRDIFSPAEWRRRMQGVIQIFRGFFTELGDPNRRSAAFGNFVHNLREHFSDLFNPNAPRGQKFLNGLRQFFSAMSAIFVSGFRLALQSVTRGLQFVANLIRNPAEAIAALRTGGAAAGGIAGIINQNLVAPLLDTLREVGPQLWTAITDVFGTLWDKVKSKLAGAFAGLLGAMFAPAVMNAAFSAISTSVIRSLTLGVGNLVGRFVASRAGVNVAQQAIESGRGAGGLAGAAGRASEVGATIPGRTRFPGGAVASVTEGANQVAGVNTNNINPASGARMAMVAAFITVGLIALVIGIVALAQYLKSARLTPADIAVSVFTVGAAALILVAVAGAAALLALAAPAAAAMPALVPVMAIMLLFAGALTLAIVGIAMLFKRTGIGTAEIGATLAAVGGSVLLFLGILAAGTALAGIGALTPIVPVILLGLVGAYAIADKMAKTVPNLVTQLAGVNKNAVLGAASKVVASAGLFGAIALSGIALGFIGSLVPLVPVILIGLAAVYGLTLGIVETVKKVIQKISTVPTSARVRAQVDIVVSILGALGEFVGNISDLFSSGSAIAGAILNPRGITQQINSMKSLILGIMDSIPVMVEKVVAAVNRVSASETALNRAQVITNILGSLGTFVGAISNAVPSVGIFENADEKFRAFTGFMARVQQQLVTLLSVVSNAINGMAAQAGTLDPAKASTIQTLATAATSIIGALATFISRMLNNNAIRTIIDSEDAPVMIARIGQFINRIVSSMVGAGGNGLINSIKELITSVGNEARNLTPEAASNLYNLTRVLGPIFTVMGTMVGLIGTIGPQVLSGNPAQVEEKITRVRQLISSLTSGIGTQMGDLVLNLDDRLSTFSGPEIRSLAQKIEPLKLIFDFVKSVQESLSAATGAGGGEGAVTAAQNGLKNAYNFMLGENTGSGWSLLNFIDYSKDRLRSLGSMLTPLVGPMSTLGRSTVAFKTSFVEFMNAARELTNESLYANLEPLRQGTIERVGTYLQGFEDFILGVNSDLGALAARRDINLNVHLNRLRSRLGLTGRQTQTLNFSNFQVNITVNVTLDVDDIENGIATREGGSTFAITQNAVDRGRITPSPNPRDVFPGGS